jgi:malto-oligosyltrehalose synthase/4-alpha-glucanotransferase
MYKPGATYRIQFHKNFTFDDFEKIIPYLHVLGIKTIYASPIFSAVSGSTHGYDGINPNEINPEIGTLKQFRLIAAELKKRGMGWLQDFAPNHMAFTPDNVWLCDYLEKGKMSEYDTFFDKNPDEPLMVPFLGSTLEEALSQHHITIVYKEQRLRLKYYDVEYPLNYTGYFDIINHEMFDSTGFEGIRSKLELLSQVLDKQEFKLLWEEILQLIATVLSQPPVLKAFEKGLKKISNDSILLRKIADVQFYRLCFWKETNHKINYRRFFTINGLICLNMQQDVVFDGYHQLLKQLITEDLIQGIRVDHIDGLYSPDKYLIKLREFVGDDVYIIVEKILESNESLNAEWPVQGTSGYDFAAQVNNALSNTKTAIPIEEWYDDIRLDDKSVSEWTYFYKEKILHDYMQGEWNNLYSTFLKCVDTLPDDVSEESLKNVIAEVLICCPVYRYYPETFPLSKYDLECFEKLIHTVSHRGNTDHITLSFFKKCFKDKHLFKDEKYAANLLHFWKRCMQMAGPLMAKGVEDTLMYNYSKSIAQNEVGNNPAEIGLDLHAFHDLMERRQRDFPISLNATSTHDTKRGEDGRARLQLIGFDIDAWFENVDKWFDLSEAAFKILSKEERYFLIQSIYAALDGLAGKSFQERLKAFIVKAAREAKSHSNWDEPNETYEDVMFKYALSLANKIDDSSIYNYLEEHKKSFVANALAQLTLKATCPGTPDFYQGSELWDFSFVDPDNRRPVDYDNRKMILNKINNVDFKLDDLFKPSNDGWIKLYSTYKLLSLRNELPEVFDSGLYEPISFSENHLCFSRRSGEDWVIVVVPISGKNYNTTDVFKIPEEAPLHWHNIFTNAVVEKSKIDITQELKQFPMLVLKSVKDASSRKAGILMPMFSLPSSFGIGGMGKESYDFISFLSKSRQRFWQILPLNPTLKENFYSPYASSSSFAGDPVYIDPEQLLKDGLLSEHDYKNIGSITDEKVNYAEVKRSKEALLLKTWKAFKKGNDLLVSKQFQHFCDAEKDWLNVYSLYVVIKRDHNELAWYKWPKAFTDMDSMAIDDFEQSHADEIGFQKWMQFLFFRQWDALKLFARQMNVSIMGDIPFYMSYDSADVWANKAYFNLDADGKMKCEAGVPPDYFSATGQAWGMPTYNWKMQEKDAYNWWMNRLAHNVRLFDLVRLDHFRAFYDYWEIPGGAEDAIHGNWLEGPQAKLFDLMKQRFPTMPFIAEDLGEMHQGVFDFRDRYNIPGMRVLQFGFENYRPISNDAPHNFIAQTVVYTGTHDNNTIVGWYKQLSSAGKKDLKLYAGKNLNKKKVAKAMVLMAYSSIAELLIIPLQDILGLDESSRINTPSTVNDNWSWRLSKEALTEEVQERLLELVIRYNR